jgi:transglutaminase-like putative cysteine protease
MRNLSILRSLLALSAIALPALLHAQFQAPTAEELKMTADPKAPGAAAVYLNREETTDDTLHFHGYYERIKVLTEKGKEQATIRIPYEHGEFKITDIRGRTIHADGTIIPLTATPSDLTDTKSKNYQVNTMVFTLPDVEVGSILEYRLDLRYDDNMVVSPTWEIQQPLFVHKAHYLFKPAQTGGWHTITNGRGQTLDQLMFAVKGVTLEQVSRNSRGFYTMDLTDIPAIPSEDWMPPLNTLRWRVEFYYTYAHSGADFWASEEKQWTKDTDRFTNPNNQLKQSAATLVAAGDSDEQKARKIYAAVMKLNNTDFGRKKSEAERKAEKLKVIKNADDVWKQQSGTSDEIALLYVALARAAGLKVWPMQVVNRNRAIFDPTYLSTYQLDDYLAIVELNGKDVYLDPGQKMCAFGVLHWKHNLASGFRLSDKGATIATTPANVFKQAAVQRTASLTIDADGSTHGIIRVAMNGPDALRWRQLALENDQEEVKKQFVESMNELIPDGVHVEFDHFTGLDDVESNLLAVVKVSGNMGTATGKRFFLPGLFFESHAKHPFVAQDKRTTPIDVHFARMAQDDVTYLLPPGFTVESSPASADVNWPGSAMLRIKSIAKDGSVTVQHAFAHNFSLLEATEYNGLHDFYLKMDSADQQQLILTRTPAAKGN